MDKYMKTFHRGRQATLAAILLLTAGIAPAAEKVTYYHLDALGSPVAASDAAGNVVWRESYQPYGERIQSAPAAQDNARWYTGHVQDPDTGLVYAGARYYDPVIGRFYAVDPVAFEEGAIQSFNRYAYGANNPYKFVDPDGRRVVISGHVAANGGGHLTARPSYHLSIVLIPDNPQDFTDRSGWTTGADGKISATLGGQPSGGNLVSSPNNPGDRLENGTFQQDVPTPQGMSDTQFINRLNGAAGSYKNDLNYDLFPGKEDDGYNSNSYVSGVLKAAGATAPSLDRRGGPRGLPRFEAPGYEKPIPLGPLR